MRIVKCIGQMLRILALVMAAVSAIVVTLSVALAQQSGQYAAPIPNFSGTWVRPYFGVEPPLSGPGPVTNSLRCSKISQCAPFQGRDGVESYYGLVGDHTNPILKPQAAEAVKKHGEIELSGVPHRTPRSQCWPGGVPYIFAFEEGMQFLQQPDKITIVYDYDHQVRHVRMDEPHPAQVTPSWYGDSVGHWESGTLVIDTIGVKIGPFAMLDAYGTPHSPALHVVERYRLINYEAALQGQEEGLNEHPISPGNYGIVVDPDYRGKGLQLQFTVEDDGVFTMPWSATVTYRRGVIIMAEQICVEDRHEVDGTSERVIPQADKQDF
jgi:hypothetical protein